MNLTKVDLIKQITQINYRSTQITDCHRFRRYLSVICENLFVILWESVIQKNMKTSKILTSLLLAAVLLTPVLTLAQTSTGSIPGRPDVSSISDLDALYEKIGDLMWKVVAIVALVLFVIAGIQFMTAQGDPGKVATARLFVLWGVVGVVIAALAYGIVSIIGAFF